MYGAGRASEMLQDLIQDYLKVGIRRSGSFYPGFNFRKEGRQVCSFGHREFAIGGRPKKHDRVAQKDQIAPLRQLRQLAGCLKNTGKKQAFCQKGSAIGGEGHFSR
jgi:hypothetical protein